MFGIMLRKFGMRPTWAESIIEAGLPNQKQAKCLDIRQNDPVLVIHRITYNDMFTPLEWVLSVYRADRFSFSTGRQLISNEEK
jgi:GntR family transcriptional regulator